MFETSSEISIPDNKSEKATTSNQFNLPNIPQKPASRGDPAPKRNFSKKRQLLLPTINNGESKETISHALIKKEEKSVKKFTIERQNANMANRSQFAKQVEEKLKMVFGGMGEQEQVQEGDSFQSEQFDFQAKVNANKDLIKLHRIKKQNQNNQIKEHKLESNKKNYPNATGKNLPMEPKKISQSKNSIYSKRLNEYKDQSMENKYLQRRKQTIREKSQSPPIRQSLKELKSKQYTSIKPPISKERSPSIKNLLPQKSIAKPKKSSNDETMKSLNLFDGIQNYLENPMFSKQKNEKPLIGLTLLKAKRDIEDKIKLINEKMGNLVEDQKNLKTSDSSINDKNIAQTTQAWRKIQIQGTNIDCAETNFDKELQRISLLQQRNSESLVKYLEHQKILLELQLYKKELQGESKTQ